MCIVRIALELALRGKWSTGFLDYILPKNSQRYPEMSARTEQASCSLSWKTVFSRLFPQISAGNGSPNPVLEYSLNTTAIDTCRSRSERHRPYFNGN